MDLDRWISCCTTNANSKYNDGWTTEYYKNELEKALEKKRKIGTQLKLDL